MRYLHRLASFPPLPYHRPPCSWRWPSAASCRHSSSCCPPPRPPPCSWPGPAAAAAPPPPESGALLAQYLASNAVDSLLLENPSEILDDQDGSLELTEQTSPWLSELLSFHSSIFHRP